MQPCTICGGDRRIPALFDGERVLPQQPLAWYRCLPDLFPSHFPVEKDGRWGLMETGSGLLAVPFGYEAVEPPIDTVFAARAAGGWGAADLAGRVLLPFRYEALKLCACTDGETGWPVSPADCSCARRAGRFSLFDRNFQPVWEDLTAWPVGYGNYLLVQRGDAFGVNARDGRPISNVTLREAEARRLICRLNGV